MKAVLTGGGTGGHIFPLVSIARQLNIEAKYPIDFTYIGPEDDFSRDAFSKENVIVVNVLAGKIRRYGGLNTFFSNLYDLFIAIPVGIWRSLGLMISISPDFVFSKGGYGSVPVVAAASILRIPIFLHESDSVPGLANKLIGSFAKRIFISYSKSYNSFPGKEISLFGNPIRSSIKRIVDADLRRDVFGIDTEKPVLLVLGGSQGSVRLNELIFLNLDDLLEKFEIIHQTGRVDYERIVKIKNERNFADSYHVYDFLDEESMALALSLASCVVSRSGSSSIVEIASVGVPALFIPLPEAAQNHQLMNARAYYEETESCIIIEEKDLSKEVFLNSIDNLLIIDLKKVRNKMEKFSKINASSDIAKKILEEIK